MPAARPLSVLVVDDYPDAADSLALLLEAAGYRPTVARSLAAAYAAVETSAPDVVLLDVRLPDGCGYELVTRLRAGVAGPLVVVTTGHQGLEERSRRAGVGRHLLKPFDPAGLLALLAEHAGRRTPDAGGDDDAGAGPGRRLPHGAKFLPPADWCPGRGSKSHLGGASPAPARVLPFLTSTLRESAPLTAMTILLSEVTAARVLCKHPSCGAVAVFAADNLSLALPDGNCPSCGRPALDLSAGHPLALLARALRAVASPETRGDVELVLGGPLGGGVNPPDPPAVVA